MKKGAKAQKLESVAEVEEEASKMSIEPKKEKKPSSRKSSKDKKEDKPDKEKSKKDKKAITKEPAQKEEQKDEIKVEKPEPIPEAPKETISSVYRDLDLLSNHLAQTFHSFEPTHTQKVTPSYHARFFEENEERRSYADNRLGEKGYVEISAQGFNGPRSNNYHSENQNHQRRPNEWYNLSEKELLQRYAFREDDIRGETPFYDQSRGYTNKSRLQETPQKRDTGISPNSTHGTLGYSGVMNRREEYETPQKRGVFMNSTYQTPGYGGSMERREDMTNKRDFMPNIYQNNEDERHYESLQNQPRPVVKQGRNIKELYQYQSRHFFVEPEMESSNTVGQRIPGRSPQASMSMKSKSVVDFKNNGSVYVNRLFG